MRLELHPAKNVTPIGLSQVPLYAKRYLRVIPPKAMERVVARQREGHTTVVLRQTAGGDVAHNIDSGTRLLVLSRANDDAVTVKASFLPECVNT